MIDEKLREIIENFKVNTAVRLIKSLVIESLGEKRKGGKTQVDVLMNGGINDKIVEMKEIWK